MSIQDENQAMLDRNPHMTMLGLRAAADGSIWAKVTHNLTGADGGASNGFITLLLLAAAYTLYGDTTPIGGFTIRPMKGRRARIGDRFVATARVTREKKRSPHGRLLTEIHIRAEVHVDDVLYASGTFKRLRRGG